MTEKARVVALLGKAIVLGGSDRLDAGRSLMSEKDFQD